MQQTTYWHQILPLRRLNEGGTTDVQKRVGQTHKRQN